MEFGTLSILKPLVAVGALAVGGMGAYNFATTGCLLGSCDAPETTAMTAASTPVESSCCASKQTAETTLVADTADADCATKCSGEESAAELASFESGMTAETCEAMKDACEAAGECPEAMKAACDAGIDCHATADATLVSDTTETECSGKTECESKTECEGTSDEVAQLETETTEG
ncbi:MAG: hypothetical protein ACF8R9_15165 [Phycisphaerales bacterium JB054]